MHCCIPTPTTDNNTSTGMIRVTLNVGRSAANCQGNVMELSGNCILYGEWSPCILLVDLGCVACKFDIHKCSLFTCLHLEQGARPIAVD